MLTCSGEGRGALGVSSGTILVYSLRYTPGELLCDT